MLLAFRRNDADATSEGRKVTRSLAEERSDDELLVRSEILGTAGDVLMGDDLAARDRLLILVRRRGGPAVRRDGLDRVVPAGRHRRGAAPVP